MNTAKWIDQQKQRLQAQPLCGYAAGDADAAEPVALSGLASIGLALRESAQVCCRRLCDAQNSDGSIAVRLDDAGPFWTTSLACIAWRAFEDRWPSQAAAWCRDSYQRGLDFLLSFGGEKVEPSQDVGHNTLLIGWPWVRGTHSWIEPTALATMALRHCEMANHPRALEAAELIIDRLLPQGGANYGNTTILGQQLRPHVLPSAMCVVALQNITPRPMAVSKTIEYLRGELQRPLASISLAWTIQALKSFDVPESSADMALFDRCLQSAIQRLQRTGENPHRLNLLVLAASQQDSPLLGLPAWPVGQTIQVSTKVGDHP